MMMVWMLLLMLSMSAQQPASASLRGVVVRADSNTPLSNAAVELQTAIGDATSLRTTSDADGNFFFLNVSPGTYRVSASRSGYIRAEYGQRRYDAPGSTIALAAGQQMNGVQLGMTAGGVISGRITDRGKPAGGAMVMAMKASYSGGRKVLTQALSAMTDDRGEYHLFWLGPGRYYVAAYVGDAVPRTTAAIVDEQIAPREVLRNRFGGGPSDSTVHVPTYFPHEVDWQTASLIEIKPGDETRADIDSPPVPAHNVRGTIIGMPPVQPPPAGLRGTGTLIALAGGRASLPAVTLVKNDATRISGDVSADGSFAFAKVLEGSYTLYATAGDLVGRARVEVGGADVTGLNVTLGSGLALSGKLIIEPPPDSTNPSTGMGALNLTLRPAMGGSNAQEYRVSAAVGNISALGIIQALGARGGSNTGSIRVEDAPANLLGSFTIPAIQPGDYQVIVHPLMEPSAPNPTAAPPNPAAAAQAAAALQNAYLRMQTSYVKAIRLGDVDVLNNGLHIDDQAQKTLEIVIGTNPGTIEGRAVDAKQQPVAAAAVALIPESPLKFRIDHKFTYTDSSGHFQLQGLAPGDYKMFVWEDIEKGAWQDTDLMRTYESLGKPVHVVEGQTTTTNVSVIPDRR